MNNFLIKKLVLISIICVTACQANAQQLGKNLVLIADDSVLQNNITVNRFIKIQNGDTYTVVTRGAHNNSTYLAVKTKQSTIQEMLYENGFLIYIKNYSIKNGRTLLNGPSYSYYESGLIRAVDIYVDNALEGKSLVYNEIGMPMQEYIYHKGKLLHSRKLYPSNGNHK